MINQTVLQTIDRSVVINATYISKRTKIENSESNGIDVTYRLVHGQFRLATNQTLQKIDRLRALFVERSIMLSAYINEATRSSLSDNTCTRSPVWKVPPTLFFGTVSQTEKIIEKKLDMSFCDTPAWFTCYLDRRAAPTLSCFGLVLHYPDNKKLNIDILFL